MLVSLARLVSTSSCRKAKSGRPVLSHLVIPETFHTPTNTPQATPSILRLTTCLLNGFPDRCTYSLIMSPLPLH